MVGESEDIRLMAPIDAVAVANANRDLIIGIKVRVGRNASGTQGSNRSASHWKSPTRSACP